MGFADRYVWSLNAHSLQDNGAHHASEALMAAALADMHGAGFGALLLRVKYGNALPSGQFAPGTASLAQLLRIWTERVIAKGRERKWVRERHAWDTSSALALYRRVAERSLAHWLDGQCQMCIGAGSTGSTGSQRCKACEGSGRAAISGGGFEREKVRDMISELEALMQAHSARAARRMAHKEVKRQ